MKVALLSATVNSINPIEQAFLKNAPEIEYFHLLDSDLLFQLEKSREINHQITSKFIDLVRLAEKSEADVLQFTCSAFNDLVTILQPLFEIPIFRSDEAVLDKALKYNRVGLVATVQATPIPLSNYLRERKQDIEIVTAIEDGAIHLLSNNKKEEHDQKVVALIKKIEDEVEVIVLSQYSLEHVKELYTPKVPLLGAATETALNIKSYYDKINK